MANHDMNTNLQEFIDELEEYINSSYYDMKKYIALYNMSFKLVTNYGGNNKADANITKKMIQGVCKLLIKYRREQLEHIRNTVFTSMKNVDVGNKDVNLKIGEIYSNDIGKESTKNYGNAVKHICKICSYLDKFHLPMAASENHKFKVNGKVYPIKRTIAKNLEQVLEDTE